MKTLRFLLAALAALFFSPVGAQIAYEYGYNEKDSGQQIWGQSTASSACQKYADSHARWWALTYTTHTGVGVVDVGITVGLNCGFKVRYYSNGTQYTTALTTVAMLQRQSTCGPNDAVLVPRWGCYIRATDTSPSIQDCSGVTAEGPKVGHQIVTSDYCVAELETMSGFAAVGPETNGWQGYKFTWIGRETGAVGTPPTPDPIPAAPSTPPTPIDGDSDGDGIPDDEEDDGEPATPLQCGAPPDFYAEQYPDGIAGVWEHIKLSFEASSLRSFLTYLVPNYQGFECGPTFTITMMDNSSHQIAIPCSVWAFIRACIMITALFFAVRLIFGGA